MATAASFSMRALTESRFTPRFDYSAASSAALAEPSELEIRVPERTGTYRLVIKCFELAGAAPCFPAWVGPTIVAFSAIASLPANWDTYGARPVSRDVIRLALETLATVMQVNSPVPSVVPLADGGIQLEWHRKQQDLEIIFPVGAPPEFCYFNRGTDLEVEGLVNETEKLVSFLKGIE